MSQEYWTMREKNGVRVCHLGTQRRAFDALLTLDIDPSSESSAWAGGTLAEVDEILRAGTTSKYRDSVSMPTRLATDRLIRGQRLGVAAYPCGGALSVATYCAGDPMAFLRPTPTAGIGKPVRVVISLGCWAGTEARVVSARLAGALAFCRALSASGVPVELHAAMPVPGRGGGLPVVMAWSVPIWDLDAASIVCSTPMIRWRVFSALFGHRAASVLPGVDQITPECVSGSWIMAATDADAALGSISPKDAMIEVSDPAAWAEQIGNLITAATAA